MQQNSGTESPVVKWNAAGVAAGAMPSADTGQKAAGPVTFVLSTDDVDRHGDVVSADGWRVEAYLQNPVLLRTHDYRHPAIGRAASVWSEPHRLLAKMEFAPGAFAQEVATLYASGFQRGCPSASGPSAGRSGGTPAPAGSWGCATWRRSCWRSAPSPSRPTAAHCGGGWSRTTGWTRCWWNCGRFGGRGTARIWIGLN